MELKNNEGIHIPNGSIIAWNTKQLSEFSKSLPIVRQATEVLPDMNSLGCRIHHSLTPFMGDQTKVHLVHLSSQVCGGPQESVLRPSLLLMYTLLVNDVIGL